MESRLIELIRIIRGLLVNFYRNIIGALLIAVLWVYKL